MRQKYVISRDGPDTVLTIREYAVTESKVKRPTTAVLEKAKFTFLCEETYETKEILGSITKGITSLIASIRTHNLYPIEPYAIKIAEKVIMLYKSEHDRSAELIFDDVDLVLPAIEPLLEHQN